MHRKGPKTSSLNYRLLLLAQPLLVVANNKDKPGMGIMHDLAEGAEDILNGVKDKVHDAEEFIKTEMDEFLQDSALAGNIWPILSKFVITPEKFRLILQNILKVTQWEDVLLIFILGWGTMPLMKYPYPEQFEKGFCVRKPPVFHIVESLSQIAKIALLVYMVDVIKIVLVCMGFTFPHLLDFPQAFAKVAYTVWFAKKIMMIKRHWLNEFFWKGEPDTLGRFKIVNRFINAFIMTLTALVVRDILSVELGLAGKSIFAFGSVGTLVLSLASQGLATQVLNGLMLSASDNIYEGDSVKFGNGISGTVVKMGWTETMLRGSDEIMVTVPNADLASQHVSNLSRIQKSQVKQTLRFQYEDVDKLPQLLKDIKKEIEASCPSLITDGTRPFRVHWTSFNDDHLEVVVDAHFSVKPVGDVYWDNRQDVLRAINRAVQSNQLKFAFPSS